MLYLDVIPQNSYVILGMIICFMLQWVLLSFNVVAKGVVSLNSQKIFVDTDTSFKRFVSENSINQNSILRIE